MRYLTAGAFRHALEGRLKRRAQATGEPLSRLRKNVVFQRLLARLLLVSPDRWVLKGGLALDFRLSDHGARPRATRDMDLARRGDLDTADVDFSRISEVDLGDHFEFTVTRAEIDPSEEKEAGGAALRFRVRAILASRIFEQVVIDVGSASSTTVPETVEAPNLLDFADLQPVRVPALPVTLHVAEKVHAYTRRYGLQRAPSSRPKDLIDLILLGMYESFLMRVLRPTLEETFRSRATHPLPPRLPPPPEEWTRPYAELARQVGIAPELAIGYEQARAFLDPVLGLTASEDSHWDVSSQRWLP